MSLRWRFALILATSAILATAVVAAAAVRSTARSLESEVDAFLRVRLGQTERIRIPDLPSQGAITLSAFGESIRGAEVGPGRSRTPILPAFDSIIQINRSDGSLALAVEGPLSCPPTLPVSLMPSTSPLRSTALRIGWSHLRQSTR